MSGAVLLLPPSHAYALMTSIGTTFFYRSFSLFPHVTCSYLVASLRIGEWRYGSANSRFLYCRWVVRLTFHPFCARLVVLLDYLGTSGPDKEGTNLFRCRESN
jgi:hypothetical protein